jgi:hypothetical protein
MVIRGTKSLKDLKLIWVSVPKILLINKWMSGIQKLARALAYSENSRSPEKALKV